MSIQVLVASLALAFVGQAHACSGICAVSVDQIAGYTYSAKLEQTGTSNSIDISQSLGAQSAKIIQNNAGVLNASGNTANVTQAGPAGDTLAGVQIGDGNHMTVEQYASTNMDHAIIAQVGVSNGATVTQDAARGGGGNTAGIYQIGSNNSSTVTQTGAGNTATASQTGSGDTLSISQSGGDYASYTQIGNNLPDMKISQTGPGSVSVVQTAFGTFK